MALLTRENLKTEQAKAGAIVAGLIGLLGIAVTNIDKIMDAYRYLTEYREVTDAKGAWLGVFREFESQQVGYVISTETFFIKPGTRDRFSGTVDSQAPLQRHHEISGTLKHGLLLAEYREEHPDRPGGIVYVLKGQVGSNTLQGFWTGSDPEERVLMACPYVLTKNTDPNWVKNQFKDWLNKDCARSPRF